jgi:large-conductance mechanosensitive channel
MFNNFIKKLHKIIIELLLFLLIFINKNYKKFIEFLSNKNIVQMIIGIIIGSQVSNFTNLLNSVIFTPIINFINTHNHKANKYNYNVLNIKFEFGKLILGFIQLIIAFLIIYIFWSLSQMQTSNDIFDTRLLNTIDTLNNLKSAELQNNL